MFFLNLQSFGKFVSNSNHPFNWHHKQKDKLFLNSVCQLLVIHIDDIAIGKFARGLNTNEASLINDVNEKVSSRRKHFHSRLPFAVASYNKTIKAIFSSTVARNNLNLSPV